MGGTIRIESEPARGTQVYVTLPFEIRDALPMTPTNGGVKDLQGLDVLVVDDNATNRRILEEMLTAWGMRPDAVEGGEAAMGALERALAAGKPFPLAIIDFQMPGPRRIRTGGAHQGRSGAGHDDDHDAFFGRESGRWRSVSGARRRVLSHQARPAGAAARGGAFSSGEKKRPCAEPVLVTRHTLRETHRSLNILVAEDNAVNRMLVTALLAKRGHTVAQWSMVARRSPR